MLRVERLVQREESVEGGRGRRRGFGDNSLAVHTYISLGLVVGTEGRDGQLLDTVQLDVMSPGHEQEQPRRRVPFSTPVSLPTNEK